ncbi:unnamed protein product [Aphanomyces euteiches]|uniref:Calmodulin-lysine N-methyltransferase n=1 Tax=Aphanomyces euteiches TaxID=100861 RepID=A0A6G0XUI7_9STRA|nr:hypothetical protein Ae201684_001258 [Aphanomyces euteiches]KAH9099591.1 hypothetical protein Ae201684P_018604 [Aphanomyces euteiches]
MDALAALLHHSDDDDDQGDYVQTIEIGKDKAPAMRISVAPDDGQAPGTLFAYHIWNGATCLAEFFAEDPTLVRGRKVVEFGAASALPSLVALHFGAKVAGMTDYPADILLQNMRDNVERNRPLLNGTPVVQGHLWGSDTTALLSHTEENGEITGFDVAIVAECLWMHREHNNLAKSINECLAPGGTAYICFSHHVPGVEDRDLAFFDTIQALFPCTVHLIKTFQVQAVFNSSKTKSEFLYAITKM